MKLFSALRDMPEVAALVVLVGATMGHAAYIARRNYLGLPGEAFASKDMRHDMEKQISYGQEHIQPALLWHVAQWRRQQDGSLDVGIWPFHNRSYSHSHELPTSPAAKQGVPHEGPSPTEY